MEVGGITLNLINPLPAKLSYSNFQPLEVVSPTATHNFKWVKMIHICWIWDHAFQMLMFKHTSHSQKPANEADKKIIVMFRALTVKYSNALQ